jgi:hypothetical protein
MICLLPVAIFVFAWLMSSRARQKEREQAEKEGRVYISDFAQRAAYKELGDQVIEAELKGSGSYVVVTEQTVFVGFGDSWSGERAIKRYPIDSISAVNLKKGLFTELEIVMPGAVEGGKKLEDRIRFETSKTPYEEVKRIADLILELRNKMKAPPQVQPAPTQPTQSVPELIQQLAALRDAGVITNEEFEQKKKDLLNRL